MAYFPAKITADWEKFEYYVARYVGCPACGGKLSILDRNAPAVDHECEACGVAVQCKFSKNGPKRYAPPSAATGWRRAVRKYGAKRIWFLTGNKKGFRFFNYTECKRTKTHHDKLPRHMRLADALKECPEKIRRQHRYSFRFPEFSKWFTYSELRSYNMAA